MLNWDTSANIITDGKLRIYAYPPVRPLNVKVLVGDFNKEKALVGAFSVIVKSSRTIARLLQRGCCRVAGPSTAARRSHNLKENFDERKSC